MTKQRYEFDRYVDGVLKAEGICIERETSEKDARAAAARMASPGDVLVMRTPDEPTPDPAKTRDMWVAWTDQDGGWIAAIGNVADCKEIESRIAAEVQRAGFNRFELRPVRITLHLNRPADPV